jgi:hypothetical protein
MRDYHENNAYVLYNFVNDLHFKGGGKVMYTINSRAMVTAEYIFLLREGNYTVYEDTGTPEVPEIVAVTVQEDFNNHIVVLGINWKF